MEKKNTYVLFAISLLMIIAVVYSGKRVIAEKCFDKGSEYYSQFDLKKASRWYEISLRIDPQISNAHYQLARIDLVNGDFERGISEIDSELRNHPDNKRSYYVRGLLSGYLKKYGEAESDFQQFIDWAPDEWPGYVDLSWTYLNDKKFEEVIRVTDEAIGKFPQNTWLLSNKGLALYKLGRYEEAEEALKQAKDSSSLLSTDEWKIAYPGNDPASAEQGVKEIRSAVSYNLSLVYEKLGRIDDFLLERRESMNLLGK